jgi:acetylornithine deacetylase/succinyl-diaminopimelate desuccinylase-like protein
LLETYRDCGSDPEIWPRTATAIGAHVYIERLGMPWIATTLGHSGHKHAPNEYLQVRGFRDSIDFVTRLMWNLARAPIPGG